MAGAFSLVYYRHMACTSGGVDKSIHKERRMDIFSMLKRDHDLVLGLIKKLEKTDESAVTKRENIFAKIKEELTVHAKSEENAVYAQLQDRELTRDFALEGTEEHEIVDRLIAKLDSISASEDRWMALVTVLKEMLEHHIDEEESDMFKKMKKEFDKDELLQMARMMKSEKQQHKRSFAGNRTVKAPIYEREDAVIS